jgi:pimeloyl-ACP methyl ester carboxylesterase
LRLQGQHTGVVVACDSSDNNSLTMGWHTVNVSNTAVSTSSPAGLLVMLHCHGGFKEMLSGAAWPWVQAGWRALIPDPRGHGQTLGQPRFGADEMDLRELLSQELTRHPLPSRAPVVVWGYSMGAVSAARWALADSKIDVVLAIAPMRSFETAALAVARKTMPWTTRLVGERAVLQGAQRKAQSLGVPPAMLGFEALARLLKVPFAVWDAQHDDLRDQVSNQGARSPAGADWHYRVVPQTRHETIFCAHEVLAQQALSFVSAHAGSDRSSP